MSLRTGVLIAVATILVAGSASAHHNMSALFDFNDRVTLTGTLTRIDWRNPHIDTGRRYQERRARWRPGRSKGRPPSFFRSRDITKIDIEAALGKTVTAEASRARDGSRSGLLRVMTLPDGKVVSACPQNC